MTVRILLTGGAGYIGSVTARMLLDAGHDVVVLDTLERGRRVAMALAYLSLVPCSLRFLGVRACGYCRARSGYPSVLHSVRMVVAVA